MAEIYCRDYFIYKGVKYGEGTKVRMSDVFNAKWKFMPREKEKYESEWSYQDHIDRQKNKREAIYVFKSGFRHGLDVEYDFFGNKANYPVTNPDEEIAEIIEPVEYNEISWQRQAAADMVSGRVYADVSGGVFLYIVIMVIGAIFKDRWILWIVGTIIFIGWLLKQYRTKE